MKIDATSSIHGIDAYRNTQGKRTIQKAHSVETADEVNVSKDAVSFAEAFSAVKAQMDQDVQGVNSYIEIAKMQVSSGTYQVDADGIASSILFFT